MFVRCTRHWRAGRGGSYHQGTLLCLRNMAPPSYRVRLICAFKHVTLGMKQKGIGDYSPRHSVPEKFSGPNPLEHNKAPFQNKRKVVIIIYLCSQMEN